MSKHDYKYDYDYEYNNECAQNISKVRSYLIATIAVALAGALYEYFSHGVYSYYMIYAFMIPLLLGCLPHVIWRSFSKTAGDAGETLLMAGVTTLTAGSLIKGALDIYGTTNALMRFYPVIGTLIVIAAAAVVIVNKALRKAAG